MDVRTYERTTCAKTMNPTGHDCGLAEWINSNASQFSMKKQYQRIIGLHEMLCEVQELKVVLAH